MEAYSILMESTRSIGYSVEAAIADVIDNSIAAFATNVEVNFFHQVIRTLLEQIGLMLPLNSLY